MFNRITFSDVTIFWMSCFTVFLLYFTNFKYALIGSVFALVNFSLLVYWFSLPNAPSQNVAAFIDGVKIGAHRGLAADAPENTLAALAKSIDSGAQLVEFDLEFTSDGVAVLMHDDTVDRTTDGEGFIGQMTHNQVLQLNAAYKFPNWPTRELVPTLREAVEYCLNGNISMIFDVKCTHPQLLIVIQSLFNEFPLLYKKAAVCSFFPQIVYKVKQSDADIVTGHTFRPYFFSHTSADGKIEKFPSNRIYQLLAAFLSDVYIWSLHTWMWKVSGNDLILAEHDSISRKYVSDWKSRGVHVVAWTVNKLQEKRMYLDDESIFLTDSMQDLLQYGYK